MVRATERRPAVDAELDYAAHSSAFFHRLNPARGDRKFSQNNPMQSKRVQSGEHIRRDPGFDAVFKPIYDSAIRDKSRIGGRSGSKKDEAADRCRESSS
jgi:hypothetical protein